MKKYILKLSLIAVVLNFAACQESPPKPDSKKGFTLISAAFKNNDTIADVYSCKAGSGEKMPALNWANAPSSSKSFVLIVEDPDAIPVAGYTWIHRVVFNIPANTNNLPEGLKNMTYSGSTLRGKTSFGDTLGGGPCPPSGQLHHYNFKLFALNKLLDLKSGANLTEVRKEMQNAQLDSAVLTGVFIQ